MVSLLCQNRLFTFSGMAAPFLHSGLAPSDEELIPRLALLSEGLIPYTSS